MVETLEKDVTGRAEAMPRYPKEEVTGDAVQSLRTPTEAPVWCVPAASTSLKVRALMPYEHRVRVASQFARLLPAFGAPRVAAP